MGEDLVPETSFNKASMVDLYSMTLTEERMYEERI